MVTMTDISGREVVVPPDLVNPTVARMAWATTLLATWLTSER